MWVQRVPGGGVGAIAYSADGRTLYTLDNGGWFTAWDTTTRTGTRLFALTANDLRRLPFARATMTGDRRFFLIQYAREVAVWDVVGHTHRDPLARDFFGSRWVVPEQGTSRVWFASNSAQSIDCLDVETRSRGQPVTGWPVGVYAFTFDFAIDGRLVALGCPRQREGLPDRLVLFDRETKTVIADLARPNETYQPRFAPDGRTLLLLGRGRFQIRDLPSGGVRADVRCLAADTVLAFHPTYPVCAAQTPDRVLTLLNLERGHSLRSFDFGVGRSVECVAFAPDGLTCAVGGSNKRFVVFDVDL